MSSQAMSIIVLGVIALFLIVRYGTKDTRR